MNYIKVRKLTFGIHSSAEINLPGYTYNTSVDGNLLQWRGDIDSDENYTKYRFTLNTESLVLVEEYF
jgi:hypothetical protein